MSKKNEKTVLQLERERREKGYLPGWLYFRCRELKLVQTMKSLEEQGRINRWSEHQEKYDLPIKTTDTKIFASSLNLKQLQIYANGERETDPSFDILPDSCHLQNIRVLLSSSDWQKLRKEVFKAANHRCQMCDYLPNKADGNYRPLHCHEVWSYDDNIPRTQKLIQLQCLCELCHDIKHLNFKERSTIETTDLPAFKHFLDISENTEEQALSYYNTEYELAKFRSQYDWKLDVSALIDIGLTPTPEVLENGVDIEELREKRRRKRALTKKKKEQAIEQQYQDVETESFTRDPLAQIYDKNNIKPDTSYRQIILIFFFLCVLVVLFFARNQKIQISDIHETDSYISQEEILKKIEKLKSQ